MLKFLSLGLLALVPTFSACTVGDDTTDPESDVPGLDIPADAPELDAYAKKNSGQTNVTCAVFPPAEIVLGEPFRVKVVRVPGYPGSWFSPYFTVEVDYPTTGGEEFVQTEELHIAKYGVRYGILNFVAPTADEAPQIAANGAREATVTAWVVEPTTGKPREYTCSAKALVIQ